MMSAKKVRKYYHQITSTSNTGKFYERLKKNDQLYEQFYLLYRKMNNRSIV